MKYDRIQETLKYITPGLYLLALLIVIHFEEFKVDTRIKDTVVKFSAILVVLLPFVGFVVGFFIECLMGIFERLVYGIKVPRPSRVVLRGKNKAYYLSEEVRRIIIKGENIDNNDTANRYQQIAKQMVGDNEIVSRHYYQSIMSRHILGAQLIASIYYLAFAGGWSWIHFMCALFIIALLFYSWYHQNCVYMKYLFAEYGRVLKAYRG